MKVLTVIALMILAEAFFVTAMVVPFRVVWLNETQRPDQWLMAIGMVWLSYVMLAAAAHVDRQR